MSRASEHTCHAEGCDIKVPPCMFMHREHWLMLPRAMRQAILDAYVPGQERRMNPSEEYIDAALEAVDWLARKEGRRV